MRSIFPIVFFIAILISAAVFGQQVNGVFTPFAKNNQWGNTVINTATYETSGYITLAGYYEGALRTGETNNVPYELPNKYPFIMQINTLGVVRANFGALTGGGTLFNSPNSSYGSTTIDKTYIATSSSTPANILYLIAGHTENGDGYMMKTFLSGARPTAYNGGSLLHFTENPTYTRHRFVEDWSGGVYTVRKSSVSFANQKILVSAFNSQSGVPYPNFGTNGTLQLEVPGAYVFNDTLPLKSAMRPDGKFYVAFTIRSTSTADELVIYRINTGGLNPGIDSSFGVAGKVQFPVGKPWAVTSINFSDDQSVTLGGYSTDADGVPAFLTFDNNGDIQRITSYNHVMGASLPGYGCKNVSAKMATINGEQRIVFAYAKPVAVGGPYQVAIASHDPDGLSPDPLVFSPWSSGEFISVEPTEIIVLGSIGYLVAGKATRPNGTFAGVAIRYKPDGTLDQTFADNGALVINGRQGGQWNDVKQMADNKYLCAGGGFIPDQPGKSALLLQKFNQDGSIDPGFGTNGTLYAYASHYSRGASQLYTYPDGKFLIGGTYQNYLNEPGIGTGSSSNKATVYKMLADGSPDNSFGPFGNGRLHFSGFVGLTLVEMKVINDTIYMAGNTATSHTGNAKAFIYKLSPDGIPYSSYLPYLTALHAFTISENTGNAFVGGGLAANQKFICKVKRGAEASGGRPDSSFGTNGLAAIPINNTGEYTTIKQVKLIPGSIFVVTEWEQSNSTGAPRGIFFNSISQEGIVNAGFGGTNGNKFLQLPGATSIIGEHYEWTNDGHRLLIFGEAIVNGVTKGFICKVGLDGNLAGDFGTNGVVWTTETFEDRLYINNEEDLVAIKNYGFLKGTALAKLKLPAAVFHTVKPGVWLGTADNDWFNASNWTAGVVPDDYTDVTISGGNVVIGGNRTAHAFKVTLQAGATLTVQPGSMLNISSDDN